MPDSKLGSPRVGLMRRGDRLGTPPPPEGDEDLAPLIAAFHDLGVATEHVVWADDALDELRAQLLGLDGVIVWVNPIQDGATREHLDPMLREVSERGVWVSAHPDVILTMGTKDVLYKTRDLGWGSDVELYTTNEDFERRFPGRLKERGRIVLKQGRGNGGNGVWKVELLDPASDVTRETQVRVQHARPRDGSSERLTLGEFLTRCEEYFAWSGCLIDQEYQERLVDGMVRCYFAHDVVVGFARQWPKGLLDFATEEEAAAPQRKSVYMDADEPDYRGLRAQAEQDWIPKMKRLLGLETSAMPVIWDADFLFGPKTASGDETFVLCEINISAVLPFPLVASRAIATAAKARITDKQRNRLAPTPNL